MIAPLRRKVIAFSGGGTGGHLFPGLAVARALAAHVEPVFLIPQDRGDAQRLAGEFRSVTLDCPRIDKEPYLFPARLAGAIGRARRILRALDAVAVVGLGGYSSVPPALAAATLRRPLYLIECNAVPGKATRFLSRFARGIGLGSAQALHKLPRRAPALVTGTPLREELLVTADAREFGLAAGCPTLLVMGGSQGAHGLNARVLTGLAACRDLDFQVLHCSGVRDRDRLEAEYDHLGIRARVLEFLPDIGRAYAVADMVLSRSGASTVAECAAARRPAVFVPYPWHKDRQQVHNAWEAVRAGAARIVEESQLDASAVRGIVTEILLEPERRQSMADAAERVARPAAAASMAAHVLESVGPALSHGSWQAEFGG